MTYGCRSLLSACFSVLVLGCGGVENLGPADEPIELGTQEQEAATLEYRLARDPDRFETADSALFIMDSGWGALGFERDGDKLWVSDCSIDERSVAVYWKTDYGRRGICRNTGGAHFIVGRCIWTRRCDEDFSEKGNIKFALGRCDETADRSCERVAHYNWTDWSAWKSID